MQRLGYDIDAINHPGRNIDRSIGVNITRPNSRYSNGWPRNQTADAELGRRIEGRSAHPELDRPERRSRSFIDLGMDAGAASGFGNIHSPHLAGIPNTFFSSNTHPAYRDTVDNSF